MPTFILENDMGINFFRQTDLITLLAVVESYLV